MSFSTGKANHLCSPALRRDRHVSSGLDLPRFSPRWFATGSLPTHGRGFFAILFLLLLYPSLCPAEIFIEPRIGFHGVFQLGRPFPLGVELSNSGRPAEGTLEIQVFKGGATKGGAPYPLFYRREIFLSAQARKTVQFTVDPDFISRPLTITFTSPNGKTSRAVDLRRYFTPTPVMLFLNDGNSSPPITHGTASSNRLVTLALAELPADARALLGVSHLVLYDQSLRELSRSQLLALDTWITTGGNMLIVGSLNYALYQEAAIGRFLPVRVTGMKRISFIPPPIQGEIGRPIADVWAQASTVVRGKVVFETQGIPVLVETNRGKGKITYLALDVGRPPLSGWDGLPRLLQNLLTPVGGDDPSPRTHWDDTVFSQLILTPSFISTYVPTGSLFLAMAGYLLGMGLVAWLWQRRRVGPKTCVIGCAIMVVASALGGHLLFSRGGNIPDGVFLSSTVMESSADGFVEAQANLAMFSTQIREYSLQLERGWIEMTPVSTRTKERPEKAVMLQDGGGFSRYQLALREWDYQLFRMRFVDRFPMRVEFEPQGDKLLMKIDNQSAKDLTDCWLLVPGQRYALGDVRRGSSWTKLFSLAAPDPKEPIGSSRADVVNFRELSFRDKTRDILFQSSFFPRDGETAHWSRGAAVFFGWVKDPDPRLQINDPRIRVYDYALFRAIVPLASSEDE